MMTRSIRRQLSKYVPKNGKDMFSSKYLRIVFITNMAYHRGVDFSESHDRSVHSIGNNQERYLDQNMLALTLPGAYDLNRWVYATPTKIYPTFHYLGPHVTEQAHFLMKELYIVYVP